MSSTTFTYCKFFKLISSAKWMWSDPSPSMLNSTQSIYKFFMCVLFETRSKSSLCPCQLKNCERNFKLILSEFLAFAAQTIPHSTIHYPIHPRSRTITTSQYVGDTCHANEKGQGHVRPISSGEPFFTVAIIPPLPFLTSFTSLDLSPARASQTLAPPLLHRLRWGRASLPRPRRRRTRADRGFLHSAAAVAVFLCRVRAWKICTDELHISTFQFVVFFVQGN